MTNDNNSPFTPTFYVFAQCGERTELSGVAFRNKKGKGFYLIMKGVRYLPFPRAKPKNGKGL